MSRRVKSENQQILKILLDRDNTTAAQLAEEIGISEKTVRNRIKEVNALLGEKKLGEIISKPKKGMILEADLKQKNQIRLLLGEVRRSDSTDETGRMSAVLRMILRSIKTPGITINEIADALCREQIARIDEGKKPAYSLADAGILVRLLDVIVHNQEDMLERELSITVFADSKTFEKSWRSRVCRILQKYGDKDADLSNKAEREIEIALLERYHIYANPSYVFMEGNGSILFQNGKTMELTAGIPLALPQRSLQKIRKISISDHALMTIENLTSFNRTEKEDTFLIYLSGYSSSLKKKLLQKIHQDNPSLRWFHFGDIDPDGFLILEDLREQTWIPFDPYCMGIEELVEYSSYCRSLNENDRKKAADLIERNLYCEVMQYMLDHNCKLEQEIISWNQSRKNK